MSKTGIVGGTFDVFHDGHRALLSTAFREGDHVIVGITSDTKACKSRERDVKDFFLRQADLTDACKTFENLYDCSFDIVKIENNYGAAIERDADFIVLSPEKKTHERAAKINSERVLHGKNRLQIIEAPMVTDYKGRKISATRIRSGEIDMHGDER